MAAEIRAMQFEDGGQGQTLRTQVLPEAEKGRETDSPLKGPERSDNGAQLCGVSFNNGAERAYFPEARPARSHCHLFCGTKGEIHPFLPLSRQPLSIY